jgi:hypothetical protein
MLLQFIPAFPRQPHIQEWKHNLRWRAYSPPPPHGHAFDGVCANINE